MNRPLLPIVLFYAIGLLAAHFQIVSLTTALSAGAICFSLFVVAFFLNRRAAATLLGMCLFSLLGFSMLYPYTPAALSKSGIMRFVGSERVNVEGVIDSTPVISDSRTRLYIKATRIHEKDGSHAIDGRIMVSMKEPRNTYCYGDRVRFFCALKVPRNFENPGGFDYARYLAYQGIAATAFLNDDRGIIIIREGEGNGVLLFFEKLRDRIRTFLENQMESPTRDVLKALIIGEQGTIPDTIREQFASLGLTHLLSISGLHVSIFALVSYLFFMSLFRLYYKPLLYINAFKVSVFLSIFPVLCYCFIAGFNIPTLRSAIMVVCYLIALLLGRREDLLHTLFVAAFVTLICIPTSLFDISFQLSFSAVLSIIVLAPQWQSLRSGKAPDPFEKKNPFLEKCRRYFLDSLLASATAILGTAPLVAVSFHYFSFAGFITNIIMIPIVTFFIVPLALVATLILFISQSLSVLLYAGAGMLTDMCLNCISVWSRMPWGEIKLSTPHLWEIGAFYLLVTGFSFCLKRKLLKYYLAAVCSFVLLEAALYLCTQQGTGTVQVTFLDVGAGDAALIEFPGHHTMLIDGGGFMDESIDIGETVIAPVLYYRGIKRIDFLVLSHPHKDHAGGLPYIAERFGVKELWMNGERGFFESYKRLMTAAHKNGITQLIYSHGSSPRVIDGVRIDFLSPLKRITGFSSDQAETNNNSLVMKFTFGKIRFLFPGDILQETEQMLIEAKAPLSATIIKVPHHGGLSSGSEEFIKNVSPEVAVFSSRSYGTLTLPRPEVLSLYRQAGARIYQTDRHGAVRVETDGKTYQVFPYKK